MKELKMLKTDEVGVHVFRDQQKKHCMKLNVMLHDTPNPVLIHTLHIHTAAWWMGRFTWSNKTIIPALHLCQVSFQRVHHLKRKEPITQTSDRSNTSVGVRIRRFPESAQRWRKRIFSFDEEVRGWEQTSRESRYHSAGPVGWVFGGRAEIRRTCLQWWEV